MAPKKPMTKAEIIEHLAKKFELTKASSKDILDEIAALAAKQTKSVGEFTIPGVGKVVKAKRKARTGRNPATGETIKIKAKTVVKIKTAKSLQDGIVPPKK